MRRSRSQRFAFRGGRRGGLGDLFATQCCFGLVPAIIIKQADAADLNAITRREDRVGNQLAVDIHAIVRPRDDLITLAVPAHPAMQHGHSRFGNAHVIGRMPANGQRDMLRQIPDLGLAGSILNKQHRHEAVAGSRPN